MMIMKKSCFQETQISNEININAKSSPLNNLAIIKPFIDNIQNPKLKKTLQDWLFNNIKYDNLHLSNLAMRINLDDIGNTLLHNTQAEIIVEKPELLSKRGKANPCRTSGNNF